MTLSSHSQPFSRGVEVGFKKIIGYLLVSLKGFLEKLHDDLKRFSELSHELEEVSLGIIFKFPVPDRRFYRVGS